MFFWLILHNNAARALILPHHKDLTYHKLHQYYSRRATEDMRNRPQPCSYMRCSNSRNSKSGMVLPDELTNHIIGIGL